jgi:hypothetical protein
MSDVEQTLVTYLDLACASRRRRRLSESDKLLVLAGVAAVQLGWSDTADECRQYVLAHNPRHMLRRWPSFAVALTSDRFAAYLRHIERQYPPEKAEYMLACLGERPVFTGSSAQEMAQALLAKLARLPKVSRATDPASRTPRKVTSKSGTARPSIRTAGRKVAKRLRAKRKTHQEFLWWPYCIGLAGLAIAIVVWLSRLHG